MARYVVEMTFVDDSDRLARVRPAHRRYWQQLADRGVLLGGGLFADESGGMLICETSDENALRRAVDGDPYTRAGLVARLRVLQWTVELGAALTAEEPGRRRGDALIRMIESGPRIDPAAVAARGRGLTAHERRIAKLILAGATNREIADRFRVSARAVELHITNIYRKLGISRRAQLAGALVA